MAAYEIPGFSYTLPSGADFTGAVGQYRFVNMDASGNAVNPSAGGECVGVRQNKPNVGQATTIVKDGVVWVEAGEAISIGDDITPGAAGEAFIGATIGETIVGRAVTAGTGAGSIVSVLLSTANVLAL